MSERLSLRWYSAQQAHQSLLELWAWAKPLLMAGHRLVISARGETRSLAQNNLMWSCLTDLSKQVKWFGKNLTPEGLHHGPSARPGAGSQHGWNRLHQHQPGPVNQRHDDCGACSGD